MAAPVSAAVAGLLAERRGRLNALFEQARLGPGQLDDQAFLAHLRGTLLPAVEAVWTHESTRAVVVLERLYALSLKLVAGRLLGPQARFPRLDAGWRRLLLAHPQWLAADAERVPAALANALYQLAQRSEAAVERWVDLMEIAGLAAASATDWLTAGKVAAWRAGMPEYRQSALALARDLDPAVGAAVLELDAEPEPAAYRALIDRLSDAPWLAPRTLLAGEPALSLRLQGAEGGFAGFGGPFMTPPQVFCAGGQLYAQSGEAAFAIHADCHGVSFIAAGARPPAPARPPGAFVLDADGTVAGRAYPQLAGASSHAATADTLAVTLPDSHFVYLLGLAADA